MADSEIPPAEDDVTRLEITVDPSCPDEGVLKIIEVIRPDWKRDDVVGTLLGEGQGCVNLNYKYTNSTTGAAMVVRIFGTEFAEMIDREQEVKAYQLLQDDGTGPKLYCLFKNGMCIEYIAGKTYNLAKNEGQSLELAILTAKALAKLHCKGIARLAQEKYEIPTDNKNDAFMDKCFDSWDESFDQKLPFITTPDFPKKEEVVAEFKKLTAIIKEMDMPYAFCHNDMHPGNLIHDEDDGRVILIDLELCSFNDTCYDLAVYLFTAAFGMGVGPTEEPPSLHSDGFHRQVLKVYLETLSNLDNWSREVTDNDVNELLKKVYIYILLMAVLTVPVGLINKAMSAPIAQEHDALVIPGGSLKSWKLYWKMKEEYLKDDR